MGFIKALLGKCDTEPLASDYWAIEGANVRVKLSQMPQPLPLGGAVYLEGASSPSRCCWSGRRMTTTSPSSTAAPTAGAG